jgi:hypothetical protein
MVGLRYHDKKRLNFVINKGDSDTFYEQIKSLNAAVIQEWIDQKLCKLIRSASVGIPTNREAEWIDNLVRSRVIENWESQIGKIPDFFEKSGIWARSGLTDQGLKFPL